MPPASLGMSHVKLGGLYKLPGRSSRKWSDRTEVYDDITKDVFAIVVGVSRDAQTVTLLRSEAVPRVCLPDRVWEKTLVDHFVRLA